MPFSSNSIASHITVVHPTPYSLHTALCSEPTNQASYFWPEVSWKLCVRELNHLSGLIGGNVFSDKNWFLHCVHTQQRRRSDMYIITHSYTHISMSSWIEYVTYYTKPIVYYLVTLCQALPKLKCMLLVDKVDYTNVEASCRLVTTRTLVTETCHARAFTVFSWLLLVSLFCFFFCSGKQFVLDRLQKLVHIYCNAFVCMLYPCLSSNITWNHE